MSTTDLVLKPSCGGCGSTTDLYGSNCKHMTLCLSCGKNMAENRSRCHDCGATLTRLIREYNVRAGSSNDKSYFIGRFVTGLPDFSKKKSAENKWSLQKDGLQNRQVTDSLREKYKNKPWLLEDETGLSQYQGQLEGAQSATYYLLMMEKKEFVAIPAGSWYNFNKVAQYKQLTLEEAEEKMKNRKKTADGYERWMMKAANNGPAAFGEHGKFDDKEGNTGGGGGGRSRKKTSEDDEGHVSDKGEEDQDEESERKNRLGLNKKDGDDDEEGPRGGDHDLDDDDFEEKGDDWEHEEIFTDDDEAVGNDPEEREDLAPEVPAPPEIKQDEEEEHEDDEEGDGLSKSGKELKELLGRAGGMNESDADDEDDDDDDDMDDDVGFPPVGATKQKDAPKEEPVDNSTSKPVATGPARAPASTSKSSKGKRKVNEEPKSSNGSLPKKVKTETESKSSVKDVHGSAKSNPPPRAAAPPPPPSSSATAGSSPAASGPVSEEEIRAVLKQRTPVTTQGLVAKFKARLKSPEDKQAFAETLKRISKIQKISGASYVIPAASGPVSEEEIRAVLKQRTPVATQGLVAKFKARLKSPEDEEEEHEDDEEGDGLSKSGKELKELLWRARGMNESHADDDDDDDMDDDVGFPPVGATKQMDAPEEEPVDNSTSKPVATGPARATASASKSSKGKRKVNEEPKSSNGSLPKKVKTESESKSSVKDVHGSAKSNPPPRAAATPPPSSSATAGSSPAASGPVSEEEIRAVLKQRTSVTTQGLGAKFKARLKSPENKQAFAEILKRISKIQKISGASYVILRNK